MKIHYKILLLLGVLGALIVSPLVQAQDNAQKFKLKPEASGKLCLDCHANFQDTLKKKFVHTPLKKGNCVGCHNPHTSSHGKLLASDVKNICNVCHESMIPAAALSTHKVVAEGNCMKCHDPHSANNNFNLLKPGNLLCFDCHKELGERIGKVKYKHAPVEKGCLSCHEAHSSAKGDSLLKNNVTALCVSCHKTDSPNFVKKHMNYPVAASRCTGCHDPHGSNMPSILYDVVHKPVMTKMCNQCHEEATSASPLKTKRGGAELCKGCHNTMYNETFGKSRVHWPLLDKQGCLSCHNPHAGKVKGLLKEPMLNLCGKCHPDTIQRQEKSVAKHEPIKAGACSACHDPHSSNSPLLVKKASTIDLCATCHDWMKHSSHPIGEKFKDPRNKNMSINCLSCHRSHGTEYKKMIPYPTTTDLCVQCHEKFGR